MYKYTSLGNTGKVCGGGKDDGPIENKIRESSGHFGVDELQGSLTRQACLITLYAVSI